MANNINRSLLIFSLLVAGSAHGTSLNLDCGANGELNTTSVGVDHLSAAAKFCQGLKDCAGQFDPAGNLARGIAPILQNLAKQYDLPIDDSTKPGSLIQACGNSAAFEIHDIKITSTRGLNHNKTGTYDGQVLEEIVQQALVAGIDPYLALGIALTENPPVKGDKNAAIYARNFGSIPVDEISAYSEMGCLPGNRMQMKYISPMDLTSIRSLNVQVKTAGVATQKYLDGLSLQQKALLYAATMPTMNRTDILNNLTRSQKILSDPFVAGGPSATEINLEILTYQSQLRLLDHPEVANDPVVAKYKQLKSAESKTQSDVEGLTEGLANQLNDEVSKTEFFDELRCVDDTSCMGVLHRPEHPFTVDFTSVPELNTPPSQDRKVCANTRIAQLAGGSQLVENHDSTFNPICCAKVKASGDVAHLLKGALGAGYIKDKVESCLQKHGGSVAYCIQTYNGTGCFGCAEKMKNQCFYKLNMATSPIYGAKVGDFMVASLMNNPEITALVQHESEQMAKPVTSLFCLGKTGSLAVDTDQFYRQQKEILSGRAACTSLLR